MFELSKSFSFFRENPQISSGEMRRLLLLITLSILISSGSEQEQEQAQDDEAELGLGLPLRKTIPFRSVMWSSNSPELILTPPRSAAFTPLQLPSTESVSRREGFVIADAEAA